MTQTSQSSPELEKILTRICPKTKYEETQSNGISWAQKCAAEYLDDKGKIILPGFDLLSGTGQNVSSYRTQLEKHNPGVKTFLKSKNWSFS